MIELDCIKYDIDGQEFDFYQPHWSDYPQTPHKIVNGAQVNSEGREILYKNDLQG